jgi:hypothetical protein
MMAKFINKFIFIFYIFLTDFYNFFFSKYEEIFLKKNNSLKNHNLNLEGYCKISNLNIPTIDANKLEIDDVNKYYRRFILSNSQIEALITNIFIKNKLAEYIFNATGYNFSIDYITAYETSPILGQEKSNSWYANLPHVDKPFTKNTLKVIIPIQKITKLNGPMNILTKNKSKLFAKNILINDYYQVTCNLDEVFIFFPNICLHSAGVPEKGYVRQQIMIQLNPSRTWKINNNIFYRQKKREPKFPILSYLFDSKTKL